MRNTNDVSLPVRRSQTGAGSPSGWSDGGRLLDPLLHPSSFFGGSPFQLMRRMHEDMDRLFAQTFSGISPSETGGASAMEGFAPSMDVSETDKEYCIEIDLPGVQPESVDVQVEEGILKIRAQVRDNGAGQQRASTDAQTSQSDANQRRYHTRERRYGYFERALSLPQNVEEQSIRAEFNHGVLTLHLPKSEPARPKAHRIPIEGISPASTAEVKPSGSQAMSADAGMTEANRMPNEQKSDENSGKAM